MVYHEGMETSRAMMIHGVLLSKSVLRVEAPKDRLGAKLDPQRVSRILEISILLMLEVIMGS